MNEYRGYSRGTAVGTVSSRRESVSSGYNITPINAPEAYERKFELRGDQVARNIGGNITEAVTANGLQVLDEQIIEHEVTVPVRHLVEEIVEKVIVVPEKLQREVIHEEKKMIRERIIHVAQPIEKKVYQDEIQIVEEEVIQYKPEIREIEETKLVEVWKTEEITKPVVKVIEYDEPVEYEVVEYADIPIPKTVECHETKVIEKVIEKPMPQYQEIEIPEYRDIEVIQEVHRNVPAATEHIVHQTYHLPALETEYEEVPLPVFVPAFTEIPVPAEYMTQEAILQTEQLKHRIALAAAEAKPSLCVIEDLGRQANHMQPDMVTNPDEINMRMANKLADYHRRQEEYGGKY